MINNQVFLINVYSLAFFKASSKTNKETEENYLISLELNKIFQNYSYFFSLLKNKSIKKTNIILKDLFDDLLNRKWKNLFLILSEEKLFYLSSKIVSKIFLYFKEKKGIKDGTIYSVIKLSEEIIDLIEQKIGNILKKKIKLTNKLNKDLIGGITVEIDKYKWDNSIQGKLIKLNKKLKNK